MSGICPENELKSLYYREMDYIDFKLYRESAWREKVWEQLSGCKSPGCLDLLTEEEIEKWKVRTLTWFEDDSKEPKTPPQYIEERNIEIFISEAVSFVYDEIADYAI